MTRSVQAPHAGARRETGAHADSDCLARLMSGLFGRTHRSGGRAPVLSHHGWSDTRELQRCTRADLSESDTFPQIAATLVWTTTPHTYRRISHGAPFYRSEVMSGSPMKEADPDPASPRQETTSGRRRSTREGKKKVIFSPTKEVRAPLPALYACGRGPAGSPRTLRPHPGDGFFAADPTPLPVRCAWD